MKDKNWIEVEWMDGWLMCGVDDEMQVSLTLKKKRGLAYVSVCVRAVSVRGCSMSDLSKQNILLNVYTQLQRFPSTASAIANT